MRRFSKSRNFRKYIGRKYLKKKWVRKTGGKGAWKLAKKVRKIIRNDAEHKYILQPNSTTSGANGLGYPGGTSNVTAQAGTGLQGIFPNCMQGDNVGQRTGNVIHVLGAQTRLQIWWYAPGNQEVNAYQTQNLTGMGLWIHECYAVKGSGVGSNGTTLKANIGANIVLANGNLAANVMQNLTTYKPVFDANAANFWIRKSYYVKCPVIVRSYDNATDTNANLVLSQAKPFSYVKIRVRNKKLRYENNTDNQPGNMNGFLLYLNDSPYTAYVQVQQYMSYTDE